MGELGWRLPGFGSVVLDVAVRRAKLLALPSDDLYRKLFTLADMGIPGNWATKSKQLLDRFGIPDWAQVQPPHRIIQRLQGLRGGDSMAVL